MEFGCEAIDRAHRIGGGYVDEKTNKLIKPIIVKFGSWRERTAFYKARPRMFSGGVKKQEVLPFRISLDLTKRRRDLLKYAKELIETNPNVLYAFADVNCKLFIKDKNNKLHDFNTKGELQLVLDKLEV